MPQFSSDQLAALLIHALPVATISWTVTHEEVFREPREWCKEKSQTCGSLVQRKLFYLFTCEYCFSFYVSAAVIEALQFTLLYAGWRGHVLAWFSVIWVANLYMAVYARLKIEIKRQGVELTMKEQQNK